jgi:hypothetical protein
MPRRNHFRQRQQRRYKRGAYRNPFLQKTQKLKLSGAKKIVLPILIVFGSFILLFLLFSHDVFNYHRVEILGTEYIDKMALETLISDYASERSLLFFKQQNQFLFKETVLTEQLLETFALANVELSTREDVIYIQLTERTSNLIWISNAAAYVSDLNGVISRELDLETLSLAFETTDVTSLPKKLQQIRELPRLYDLNNVPVTLGSQVLKEIEAENILRLHDGLDDLGISFERTEIDRLAGKWMRIVTTDGFAILFDASGDIESQLKNLDVVLREEVGESRGGLQYIDLRFGDRVYYK